MTTTTRPNLDQRLAEKILSQFPDHRIVPREEIGGGRSGAPVWLARIEGPHFNGFVYAKFDTPERCAQQVEKHLLARTPAMEPYIPAILKPTAQSPVMKPVEGWSAVLYEAAHGDVHSAATLAKLIEDDQCDPAAIAAQIKLLVDKALAVWHKADALETVDPSVPEVITRLMTVDGDDKTIGLEERLRRYGFAGAEHRKLNFLLLDVTTPNPIGYIAKRDWWQVGKGAEAKPSHLTLSLPVCPAHGDLHAENVICALEGDRPTGTSPQMIDLVLYEPERPPFYDLAYLELDILLRCLKARPEVPSDWTDWVRMTEFLSRAVLPEGNPDGREPSYAWMLIKPIREGVNRVLDKPGMRAEFSRAWWLSAAVVGALVTRRSRMEKLPGERKATLLYAGRCLNNLIQGIETLKVPYDHDQSAKFPIQWGELAPLDSKIIHAYRDGLYRNLETLSQTTVALAGEVSPHPTDPRYLAPDPDIPDDLADLIKTAMGAVDSDLYRPEAALTSRDAARPVEPADLLKELKALSRVVLLGEPGAGKTTTLMLLAFDLLQEHREVRSTSLPVFVPLRSCPAEQDFEDFALSRLGGVRPYYEDPRQRASLPLVWLLDALNEMPARTQKGEALVKFIKHLPGDHRVVLSCRRHDYDELLSRLPDVNKLELRDFGPRQIKEVLQKRLRSRPDATGAVWAALCAGADPETLLRLWDCFKGHEDAFWEDTWEAPLPVQRRVVQQFVRESKKQEELLQQLDAGHKLDYSDEYYRALNLRRRLHRDPRKLMLACRRPHTLNMVIEVVLEGLKAGRALESILPDNVGQLYLRFVTALLERERKLAQTRLEAWAEDTIPAIKRTLARIAEAIQRTEQRTEIGREEALAAADVPDAENLLKKAEAANLIQWGEKSLHFTHQRIQEYFAGLMMLEALEAWEQADKSLTGGATGAERFFPTWWEGGAWYETAILLGETLRDPDRVALWLAGHTPENALAVVLNYESGRSPESVQGETRTALLHSAQQKGDLAQAERTHTAGRASAWRVLGKLREDKRPGVLDFNIPWCRVPAGAFQMSGDPQVGYRAWEGARIPLDYDYWIAPYPVTYAQYAQFVADDGYTAKYRDCWTDAGWRWKGDKTTPQVYWNDPRWHIPNHPVVGVTWYEAYAFTRWLNKHGLVTLPTSQPAYEIRLPTEAEWEKAARYPDGRKFPWGDEFDPTKCNTSEENISRTTAVGIYPQGKQDKIGAFDLAGNVWDWCLSKWAIEYQHPEDNAPEGDSPRVLRGGSWLDNEYRARAAFRSNNGPYYRYHNRGCRVVVAPVSL